MQRTISSRIAVPRAGSTARPAAVARAAIAVLLVLGVLVMHGLIVSHDSHAVASAASPQLTAAGTPFHVEASDTTPPLAGFAVQTGSAELSMCHDGCDGDGVQLWHACLAMLTVGLVILAVALQRGRNGQQLRGRGATMWHAAAGSTAPPRRPSLTQLCVLRT